MAWTPEPEEPNAGVDWVELIDFQKLDPKVQDQTDTTTVPRVFSIRVKSSSNDSEWLIHNPVQYLTETLGKQFPELELSDKTKVTTFIVNHHNTLSGRHLYATASTTDDGTVGLTLVKITP